MDVYLEPGQKLGHIDDVVLCPPKIVDIGKWLEDIVSQAAVNALIAEHGTGNIPTTDMIEQDKQK